MEKVIKKKLMVTFFSKHLSKWFDCLVDYEFSIEIDEGVQWKAVSIESDEDDPEISITGDLNARNEPTTENLIIQVEHNDHTTEIIHEIKVLECE